MGVCLLEQLMCHLCPSPFCSQILLLLRAVPVCAGSLSLAICECEYLEMRTVVCRRVSHIICQLQSTILSWWFVWQIVQMNVILQIRQHLATVFCPLYIDLWNKYHHLHVMALFFVPLLWTSPERSAKVTQKNSTLARRFKFVTLESDFHCKHCRGA